MKKIFDTVQTETLAVRKEIRERTVGYIVAGLGVVAGLAWSDAIRAVIEYFFPVKASTVMAKAFYAVFITTLVVIAGVYLSRAAAEKKK